jgi:hypothetical protein
VRRAEIPPRRYIFIIEYHRYIILSPEQAQISVSFASKAFRSGVVSYESVVLH